VSQQKADETHRFTVLTWNLQGRAPAGAGLPKVLDQVVPDLILLQEVDPDDLAADATLADWQWYAVKGPGRTGMAILSRHQPLQVERLGLGGLPGGDEVWDRPRVLLARLSLADGKELLALNVHARAPMPVPFLHAGPRNRQLTALGTWVAGRVATGNRIVVGGDFNSVRRRLDGLVDSAAAVRREATWRPFGVPWLPALLRLDRVFVSPSITPVANRVMCRASWSDHCPLLATLSL
jgi:endonuclease/exonuclease/phosphatase family metal-dependent hydrolase